MNQIASEKHRYYIQSYKFEVSTSPEALEVFILWVSKTSNKKVYIFLL
jgi:hypothetical protein